MTASWGEASELSSLVCKHMAFYLEIKFGNYWPKYMDNLHGGSTRHVAKVSSSFHGWKGSANLGEPMQSGCHVLDLAYNIQTLEQISRDERVPLRARHSAGSRLYIRFMGVVRIVKISSLWNWNNECINLQPSRFWRRNDKSVQVLSPVHKNCPMRKAGSHNIVKVPQIYSEEQIQSPSKRLVRFWNLAA